MFSGDPFETLDPAVFDLRGGLRDSVIKTLLSDESFAELNQSQARREFREAGFSFRDSTFNALYNEVVGISALPRNISRLGWNTLPLEGYFYDSATSLPKRYRYIVEYDYADPDDGRMKKGWVTLDSNSLQTIGDTITAAESYIYGTGESASVGEVTGARVRKGLIDITR